MKKFFLKTALLLIILLPVACEITLPYDNGNTNIDISVNALYTPDTTVSVLVAKTLSPATANIYSKDPISNANVEMTVNRKLLPTTTLPEHISAITNAGQTTTSV